MRGSLEFPRPSSNNPGERKFPGGSVLMAMRFPEGIDSGQGTRIPQAVQCGQKKKTPKKQNQGKGGQTLLSLTTHSQTKYLLSTRREVLSKAVLAA